MGMSKHLETQVEELAKEVADLKARHLQAVEDLRNQLARGGCPVLGPRQVGQQLGPGPACSTDESAKAPEDPATDLT